MQVQMLHELSSFFSSVEELGDVLEVLEDVLEGSGDELEGLGDVHGVLEDKLEGFGDMLEVLEHAQSLVYSLHYFA